ncbi:hypothetical protein [Desulfotalea psychrophila]|uniref:Uncharacterized protein n=1 Tax=Desulfotalea psychrophila (strain LSv54 / DSM 12343) TaxID=177439 RepID=Q6AND0_DESPS|nr:hypothetical protein [Desulfotalea psychrophila]CAG36144.1 unknown protein [Desulfotalea psychrophila LSv54]
MYLKIGKEFADSDFYFLTEMLEHLDFKVKAINNEISLSADPDSDRLCDKGEYFIGVGFSLIQRYISSTYPQLDVRKDDALKLGKKITDELSYIKVINAGANYWKHQDGWGLINCVTRDINALNKSAKYTINTIKLLTPWGLVAQIEVASIVR